MTPDQPKQVQEMCETCGGTGVGGEVTQDMATDAGYGPEIVGQSIPCGVCGGDGWIVTEEAE